MKFCNKEVFDKIDAYIYANRDRIIEDLMTLVRIPSVQGEATPDMPYGEDCDRMLIETDALYRRHGFSGKINHEGGYAVSYYGDGKKTIGLFSHGDVVPVDGEWLMCPPFEPIIRDGYIFGRGCNDDKSGILETVWAAEIIRELGFDLKSRLLMFTGVNEETGMGDIEAYVKNEPMPELSIVPDGGYPCYSGECTILRFKLISENKFKKIKKIYGGKVCNVILGEVTAEISYDEKLFRQIEKACRENDGFEISHNSDIITVVAKGISSHVISPENSLNAGKVLADMLTGCDALGQNDIEILKSAGEFLADGYGTGLGVAFTDKDFGKLVCGNGIINTTDGALDLFFDIRVGPEFGVEELRAKLRGVEGWEYHEMQCSEGYYLDEDNPLRALAEKTYAAVSGIENTVSEKIAGMTHAKRLKNAVTVGTVGYYKAKPIDLPAGHGGVHQPDEKMSLDGFFEAIKILTCMIMEADAMINK